MLNRGASKGSPIHVPPRTVLSLDVRDWRYGNVPHGPLSVSVERVRWELAEHYDGEVWLDGYQTDATGAPLRWVELLVRVDALRHLMEGFAVDRRAG